MNGIQNRFLVLDSRIVPQTENVTLKLGTAQKDPANPLFSEEHSSDPPKRWEARYDNFYPTVIRDDDGRFRLWYNVFTRDGGSEETPLPDRATAEYRSGIRSDGLLYAESRDGIHWDKPDLGIVEFADSTRNNLVMSTATHGFHGAGVLSDPDDPEPGRRFKAFFRNSSDKRMAVAFSPDGLHWDPSVNWPEHDAVGDTHNNAMRMDGDRFVGITRAWAGPKDQRLRVVVRSESRDFVNWSEPVEVLRGDGQHDQIYSMPVFRYGPTYLGLPAVFHKGDRTAPDWDTVDTELAWSPDTITWHRIHPGTSLIPRGTGAYPNGEYDCGCIYSGAPVLADDTLHLYYGGSNGLHNGFREGSLCLATLSMDRFAGYAAGTQEAGSQSVGRLTTAPLILERGEIMLNADVADGGSVRAALIGEDGAPLRGFSLSDSDPIRDGAVNAKLSWTAGSPPTAETIRMEIELSDATVYALAGVIRFNDEQSGGDHV